MASSTQPGTTVSTPFWLPTLDGWRAVAIILVILTHAHDSVSELLGSGAVPWTGWMESAGLLGVRIFFAISGFLITSRLLEEESTLGRVSLKAFYVRRGFRILPAALLFLAVAGFLALFGVIPLTWGRWVATLFFSANYSPEPMSWYVGHFWSLAVEEHFYFLWPAVFLFLRRQTPRERFLLVAAAVLILWRTLDLRLNLTHWTPAYFWGRTDIQVDSILWGVLAALLRRRTELWDQLVRFLGRPGVWPIVVGLVLLTEFLGSLDWKILVIVLPLKAVLIVVMLIGTVTHPGRLFSRFLESPPLRWIGRISYSLYLWQQIFLVTEASRSPGLGFLQSFPLSVFLAFVCASISFYLVEKPLVKIGHRVAKNLMTTPQ